jgi:hypothetical protein
LKILPVIIALILNLVLITITLISFRNIQKNDISKAASRLGYTIAIKGASLLLLLIISISFFDIQNAEFGIFFGIFLFLGILFEIMWIIRKQNAAKKSIK